MGVNKIIAWPFSDPPNVAVFTNKKIVNKTDWIQRVTHDEGDGAWQFHPQGGTTKEEASIVGLNTIADIDPSILALYDLPLGWCAWRKTQNDQWSRGKI